MDTQMAEMLGRTTYRLRIYFDRLGTSVEKEYDWIGDLEREERRAKRMGCRSERITNDE